MNRFDGRENFFFEKMILVKQQLLKERIRIDTLEEKRDEIIIKHEGGKESRRDGLMEI